MPRTVRFSALALVILLIAALAGCSITPPASMPMRPEAAAHGITLVRAVPAELPEKAVAVPHAQFVLVPNESAAGLLVPVPVVAEAISGVFDHNVAEGLQQRYASIAPYRIALAAMRGSPLDAFKQPSAATLATLQAELTEAAAQLRELVERGARGQLGPTQVRAQVGSLHLVGGRSAGLLSPTMVLAKDAEVIEETGERVIVRLPGFMGLPGTSGGLFFGVHVLRKDQLHTFNKS